MKTVLDDDVEALSDILSNLPDNWFSKLEEEDIGELCFSTRSREIAQSLWLNIQMVVNDEMAADWLFKGFLDESQYICAYGVDWLYYYKWVATNLNFFNKIKHELFIMCFY